MVRISVALRHLLKFKLTGFFFFSGYYKENFYEQVFFIVYHQREEKSMSAVRKSRIPISFAIFALLLLAASPAAAFDSFLVGPRAMGMGGANIASVNNTTAQYYNPAAFGFFGRRGQDENRLSSDNNDLGRKSWGVEVNAAGGYRLHNEFGTYLDDLADFERADLTDGIDSQSDLENLIKLVGNLSGLDDPGNAITADANAGVGIRFRHFGIGARAYFQASGRVLDVDTQNLGLTDGLGTRDLNVEINNTTITGNDGQTLLLNSNQQQLLINAGLDSNAIQKIDFLARQEGLKQENLSETVDLLAQLTEQTIQGTGGSLEENTTTVLLRGFALAEVPLSYGYAINDHWSVGGNVKLMRGRVYGNQIIVFEEDSGDILAETDEMYKETNTFGVDAGIMGRYRYVNFGLVGRNLNSPEFDGFTMNGGADVEDVKLEPQFAGGIAFIPTTTLTLEADLDLTENETTLKGYDTRNLSFGLEWDAFRFLALRAGAYKNLAEDDIGWVYTAGLGLNLWAVRLDVAGAFSSENEEFDGDEIPAETRLAAQLSVDF